MVSRSSALSSYGLVTDITAQWTAVSILYATLQRYNSTHRHITLPSQDEQHVSRAPSRSGLADRCKLCHTSLISNAGWRTSPLSPS